MDRRRYRQRDGPRYYHGTYRLTVSRRYVPVCTVCTVDGTVHGIRYTATKVPAAMAGFAMRRPPQPHTTKEVPVAAVLIAGKSMAN